jgi:hypothetical protein
MFFVAPPKDGRFRTQDVSFDYPTHWRHLDDTVETHLPVGGLRWAVATGFEETENFAVLGAYQYPRAIAGPRSARHLASAIVAKIRRKLPTLPMVHGITSFRFHGLPAFKARFEAKQQHMHARVQVFGAFTRASYYLFECDMSSPNVPYSFAPGCDMILSTLSVPGESRTAAGPGPSSVRLLVRRYFRADARRDALTLRSLSAEPLRTFWSWEDAELGACACKPEHITIARLRVLHQTKTEATVSFYGLSSKGTVFSGPLEAVRINGQWLVADYLRNGRPVRESILPGIRGSQSESGLRLEILGLYMPDGAGDL